MTAHALVRLVLAARTGAPAADLRFDRTCRRCGADHGKPELVDDGPAGSGTLAFNLAHAGDRVVVAVLEGNGPEVGVDVEPIPGPADPVMASGGDGILTPAELASFRRMPSHRRPRALVAWWTRKEAVLKATGQGLSIAPSTFEVTAPDSPPVLMVRPGSSSDSGPDDAGGTALREPRSGLPGDARSVSLRDLGPGPGYVGCVAVIDATTLAVTEHEAGRLLDQA